MARSAARPRSVNARSRSTKPFILAAVNVSSRRFFGILDWFSVVRVAGLMKATFPHGWLAPSRLHSYQR